MKAIRVLTVTDVRLQILKSNPPRLVILADGQVPTTGWCCGELLAWRYIVPPADGIQDFDFVAVPPAGRALQVVAPIHAELDQEVDFASFWGPDRPLRGVRIHAREDSKMALLDAEALPFSDHPVPWPWGKAGGASAFGLPDLTGMLLRAYHTGDVLTDDYRRDRVNIELGLNQRIAKVWFG